MQEKKFKVQPLKVIDNFKPDIEYWVYMVKVSDDKNILSFLMYDELLSKWMYYDANLFRPVKERSADELLADFQKTMKQSNE